MMTWLAMSAAARLKEQVIRANSIPWSPYKHKLEREEDLSEFLVRLITWLKHSSKSVMDGSSPYGPLHLLLHHWKMHSFEINLSTILHEPGAGCSLKQCTKMIWA